MEEEKAYRRESGRLFLQSFVGSKFRRAGKTAGEKAVKKILVVLGLAVMFAAPAFAQETKNILPLSEDFAKAGLKAIFALRDFRGDVPDASRVKGLMEDAEIAVSTDGDKAEMHMLLLYETYCKAYLEMEQIDNLPAGDMQGQDVWKAAINVMKTIDLEMMTTQHIGVNDTRVPEFFDATVLMLKNRKAVFYISVK